MKIARLRGGSSGRAAESLRVVESVVHCGELSGESSRGLATERRVRPGGVAIGHPFGDDAARMSEAEEQRLVQKLVPHLRIEYLADAVPHRLARLRDDQVQGTPVFSLQASIAFEVNSVP